MPTFFSLGLGSRPPWCTNVTSGCFFATFTAGVRCPKLVGKMSFAPSAIIRSITRSASAFSGTFSAWMISTFGCFAFMARLPSYAAWL